MLCEVLGYVKVYVYIWKHALLLITGISSRQAHTGLCSSTPWHLSANLLLAGVCWSVRV